MLTRLPDAYLSSVNAQEQFEAAAAHINDAEKKDE